MAGYKYNQTAGSLAKTYHWFYNDLKFIKNVDIDAMLLQAVKDAVAIGETKFDQPFGGWVPKSTEFGIAPLRPKNLDYANVRWRWSSGTTSSINWSAADTLVDSFSLDDDEMMVVFGYFNNTAVQNTKEIQISPGNVKLPVWNVEPMRMKDEQYLIFPQPIIVEPRSPFQVDAAVISGTTSTAEECGLLGYFFAPNSVLIAREP
jgi:hypothetical protein